MTRNQIVQWILLPGGLDDEGLLKVSLFVTPRLHSDEGNSLADFPDFVDWPAALRQGGLQITLQRDDGATETPMQIIGDGNSELWQALFPPSTPVRPFEFDDYADRPLITYPLLKVLDYFQDRWASLAAVSRDQLPIATPNASPIGGIDLEEMHARPILTSHFDRLRAVQRMGIFEGVADAQEFSHRLDATLRGAAARAAQLRAAHHVTPQSLIEPFAQDASPTGHLYQLAGFHRRPERTPADFPADRDAAKLELLEHLEFHHLLSTLGDHPALLRALGLVIDLLVRPDFVPTVNDQDPPTHLRVVVARTSAFPTRTDTALSPWNLDVTPWTQCRLSLVDGFAFFSPAERTARVDFSHGFIHMDPARFSAVEVDVDGLALKAFNMAATLDTQEANEQRPVEEPTEAGTPTIRTGGVALVHTNRAQELHDDFYQARVNNDALTNDPTQPLILAAEDLVRGYRMDIFDGATNAWRSLHARSVTYTPLRSPDNAFTSEDEGMVQVSLTGEVNRPNAPADPDGALYVHETLVTWDGWSLAAKRPGDAIPQEPAVPAAGADLGALNLDVAVSARPGSLPQLRFGNQYRLRMRTVDLAGNSHTIEQANNRGGFLDATGLPTYTVSLPQAPLVYRRFEPVPPPDLVPRLPFRPGEGVDRLVVRSNFDLSAEAYASTSQGAAAEMLRFSPFCDRHMAAAKASLQLAETHGMFDDALASVRGLTVEDAAAAVQAFYLIAARESGSFRDRPDARFVATGEHQGVPQGFVTIDADSVELPYLPDPWCGGILVRARLDPDQPEEVIPIEFRSEGDWYQLNPVRMRLEEGNGLDIRFDAQARLLTIRMPRGRTASLRLNSLFVGDPDLFGIMQWCRSKLSPQAADEVAKAIVESRHWMTTPWRTIDLVHAVQQPLEEPILGLELEHAPAFHRVREDSAAQLAGRISLDIASTAQIDLIADWDEVIDDPTTGVLDVDNMMHHVHTTALAIPLPEPFGTPWSVNIETFLKREGEQEITFNTRGEERQAVETKRRALLQDAAQPGLSVQERNRLTAAAAHLEQLRPHEFGDTKYRTVQYQLVASTRFREYFDPTLPVEAGVRRGNVESVEMLSSAPPAVPSIIDVVPILRWEEEDGPDGARTSHRRARGLRVWLARPWFSSGAGEMLALVCDKGGPLTPSDPLYREVTHRSQDPSHVSPMPLPLRIESFTGADVVRESVDVRGATQKKRADMVAFHPHYDPIHDAWFSDIEFDPGAAYFPFVRLGLMRYQPKAIPGSELSTIVPTSFVQTLPDRTLTVIAGGVQALNVALRGPAPRARRGLDGAVVPETNVVNAVIEAQMPHLDDPFLGWQPVGDETLLAGTVQADGSAVWRGDVALPAADGRKLRLAVYEYEMLRADDPVTGQPMEAQRLVHADVIALP